MLCFNFTFCWLPHVKFKGNILKDFGVRLTTSKTDAKIGVGEFVWWITSWGTLMNDWCIILSNCGLKSQFRVNSRADILTRGEFTSFTGVNVMGNEGWGMNKFLGTMNKYGHRWE